MQATVKRQSPITEMIIDMVKQSNDIRFGKTEKVIDRIVDISECMGCNKHLPNDELTVRKYIMPFSFREQNGKFCAECQDDSKIKSLFL